MKKQLFLLFSFLTFSLASAQLTITSPGDYWLCPNVDGFIAFDLNSVTPQVLGSLSPNNYSVSYHNSLADAQSGINPLSSPYFTNLIEQFIYVRVWENANASNFGTAHFALVKNQAPVVPDFSFDVCDYDGTYDGYSSIDLGSVFEQVLQISGYSFNDVSVNFYETYTDAQMNANPIGLNGYTNINPFTQILYVGTQSNNSGCRSVSTVNLIINQCSNTCEAPTNLAVFNVTQTSATLAWTDNNIPNPFHWEVYIVPVGAPAPTETTVGSAVSQSNPFVYVGLQCGVGYSFYVRSGCNLDYFSTWSGPMSFQTVGCLFGGQPVDITQCFEGGQTCFDLTANDNVVLNGFSPANFSVTYYDTYQAAITATAAIATPSAYCVSDVLSYKEIYVRLQNTTTGEYEVSQFYVISQQYVNGIGSLETMNQCDEDNDGVVTFNLTSAAAALNTSNPLTYYTDSTLTTPILTPEAFSLVTQAQAATIYILESLENECDLLYSVQLYAAGNCNPAAVCSEANSLCNALGVPFNNTTGQPVAQTGNDYGCLVTTPNPTWFYIPVAVSGPLSFEITQANELIAPTQYLDVDYICYGPFSNPVTPCSGLLTAANTVSCSYSANSTEDFTIPNATTGQFYLIMVTNFSDNPGYITITQTNEGAGGAGEIDCTGLRLNAFLDTNSNGQKDSDEPNFPLGQFNYEKNNDANVHNITSPSGTYNLYDTNPANSYDLGYTIDPAYAANYALTTASYSNVSTVAGAGMQQYFFPVTVTESYNDLAISIVPITAPRPGFAYSNKIIYSNLGSAAVSGTVSFTNDALVSITGNTQSGTTSNANGFSYNFTNLQPFESREITVTMQVPTIPTVAIGNYLTNAAAIVPLTGDVAPENNSSVSSDVIIGSYDPNDKMESHGRDVLIADFSSDDYLYYTVRFENTGTAAALNVKISDLLDSKLDETTVKMVSSSHEDYILDRVDNQLTWSFENIDLPSVSQDANAGKGYVYFKVKPKSGYAIGDIIPNTALIYFDFNPAIVTNTFETHFVETLSTGEFWNANFMVYPNPADESVTVSLSNGSISGLAIYDMMGKNIMTQKAAQSVSETIDVSGISAGMYFLEVTTGTAKEVRKLIIR